MAYYFSKMLKRKSLRPRTVQAGHAGSLTPTQWPTGVRAAEMEGRL